MTDGETPADELSPAEQRLSEHLALLRDSPPMPAADMIDRIVRSARWQAAIRDPLVLAGAVAAALGDGIRMLLGASGAASPASDEEQAQ